MAFSGLLMDGGQKGLPSLKSVTHINEENWHTYTLTKEGPKNTLITWHISYVVLTSVLFHRRSANFAISRNTDIDCILILNF